MPSHNTANYFYLPEKKRYCADSQILTHSAYSLWWVISPTSLKVTLGMKNGASYVFEIPQSTHNPLNPSMHYALVHLAQINSKEQFCLFTISSTLAKGNTWKWNMQSRGYVSKNVIRKCRRGGVTKQRQHVLWKSQFLPSRCEYIQYKSAGARLNTVPQHKYLGITLLNNSCITQLNSDTHTPVKAKPLGRCACFPLLNAIRGRGMSLTNHLSDGGSLRRHHR